MTREENCGLSFEALKYCKNGFANRKVKLHKAFFNCIVQRNLSTYSPITFSMGDIYRKRFDTVPRLDSLGNIPGKEPAGCGQYRSHMVPGRRRAYMPLQPPAFDSTSEMSHTSLPLLPCAI